MREFNYVFGVGPGKSGTHSLWNALEMYGVNCLHFGNDCYVNNGTPVATKRVLSNVQNGHPALTGVPARKGYLDYPMNETSPELLEKQYPDSLFILTYRNPDDIAFSWSRMVLGLNVPQNTNFKQIAENTRRIYDRWLTFAETVRDRFLVLDTRVTGPINMKKLANFLQVEPLDVDWPHEFSHEQWYKQSNE